MNFSPVARPERETLRGRFVSLHPLDADADAESLFAVSHPPGGDPAIWTYLPYGPYPDLAAMGADLRKHLVLKGRRRDSAWYTIVDDEWPVRAGFERWLAPANFGPRGRAADQPGRAPRALARLVLAER